MKYIDCSIFHSPPTCPPLFPLQLFDLLIFFFPFFYPPPPTSFGSGFIPHELGLFFPRVWSLSHSATNKCPLFPPKTFCYLVICYPELVFCLPYCLRVFTPRSLLFHVSTSVANFLSTLMTASPFGVFWAMGPA